MTTLPRNECAIVSRDDMTEIELLVPALADDDKIPRVMAWMMACAMRFHEDVEFVEAQIDWLEKRIRH